MARAPAGLLPAVCYLCQGLIAPEFAGVDLGLAEKLAVWAVATATGAGPGQVAASVRETDDLGQVAEQMLAVTAAGRAASLEVAVVVDTLHRIAGSEGPGSQGRKLDLLAGLLARATPLEARYLLRLVTGGLRLGIGTPAILDALAQVHAGGRAARPVLERACNICCDLGQVASALAGGGVAAVEQLRVRLGNPVRAMLAAASAAVTWLAGDHCRELGHRGLRMIGVDRVDPGQDGSDRGVITRAAGGEPAPRHRQQPRLPGGDLLRRPRARFAGHRLQRHQR